MKRAPWLLLLPLLAGCDDVYLQPVSEPPPTRVAKVESFEDRNTIELSKGVALAVECRDTCHGPCWTTTLEPEDSAIVLVRRAYNLRGVAEERGGEHNPETFVLAGLSPGTTTLSLKSHCRDETYTVTVVE